MPIEFNCRFCDARIRVPDNAGGGKGKCPKCGQRITVPKKSTIQSPILPKIEDEPFALPVAAEDPATEDSEVHFKPAVLHEPEPSHEPVVFDPVPAPSPKIGDLSFEPPKVVTPKKAVARRVQRRKSEDRLKIAVGVGAFVVIIAAALILYPILTAEHLVGEFTAGTSRSLEVPPVVIPKSRIDFELDELDPLLKKLKTSPLPMTSNSMQIQLRGTEQGLEISVAPGSRSQFYRVNLKGNDAVDKYLDRHLEFLEERRTNQVDRSLKNFFQVYQKVLAKKATPESITPFRDTLALPTLTRGFGNQLVAISRQIHYRCVYEDRAGGLYFLLPTDVTEFEVTAREGADLAVKSVEFKVKVEGEIAQPKKAEDQTGKKPDPDSNSKEPKEKPDMDGEDMKEKK